MNRLFSGIFFLVAVFSLQAKEIEVMFYNAENFFDAKHSKDSKDWTYAPKALPGKVAGCKRMQNFHFQKTCLNTDWTEQRYQLKVKQISDIFTKNRSKVPDIIGLAEIENSEVLKAVAENTGHDGTVVVTSGEDNRGINVGLLYKKSLDLNLIKVNELPVKDLEHPTRNILECHFSLKNGQRLILFVNHWPSQANPTESRLKAAEVLSERIDELYSQDKETRILVMGDFNTLTEESPNPIKAVMENTSSGMVDLHFFKTNQYQNRQVNYYPQGTYFYAKTESWNMFDRVLVSKNMLQGQTPRLVSHSFQIYAPSFATQKFQPENSDEDEIMIPKRYNVQANSAKDAGYSDHFPVLFKIEI